MRMLSAAALRLNSRSSCSVAARAPRRPCVTTLGFPRVVLLWRPRRCNSHTIALHVRVCLLLYPALLHPRYTWFRERPCRCQDPSL